MKKQESKAVPVEELNLRVSVAALVRVLFENPVNGKTMLALERTATLRKEENKSVVVVKAKPFGGGVRLLKPQLLKKFIGEFRYDRARSRVEGDFRLQINPEKWVKVKELCNEHLKEPNRGILDPSPVREISEEFEDCLGICVTPDEYYLTSQGMIVEELLTETQNVNALGHPTLRIYYIFEATFKKREIIDMMMDNSKRYPDTILKMLAKKDARQGGKGRANAFLTLFLDELNEHYRSLPTEKHIGSILYKGHQLAGNVPVILDINKSHKYRRLIFYLNSMNSKMPLP